MMSPVFPNFVTPFLSPRLYLMSGVIKMTVDTVVIIIVFTVTFYASDIICQHFSCGWKTCQL